MSKTAIIKSGESFFIKQLSMSKPIKLDQVIFANVPGVNGNSDIDLNGKIPAANQIVHKAPVTQAGLLNDRTVVYSIVLDTNVGDFSFNYIGLMNAETNTLCVVMHTDLTKKIKTVGQQQGNTITESIWLELDNASTSTGITVDAKTWQIDYSSRMAAEDERIRLTNYDLYNRLVIINGMNITKSAGQLTVSPGLSYVAGLRVELLSTKTIKVDNNQSLYIDCWLAGTATGEWTTNYNLIAGTNLKDYEKGFKHYVERIASIDAAGNLSIVNSSKFVTTQDLATTKKIGIVKLNSSTNSTSETEAATPLAIKTVNDNAVKKAGDMMSGQLRLSATSAGIKFLYENGDEMVLRTGADALAFMFYSSASKQWSSKLRYANNINSWQFNGVSNVTINGKLALKTGDGGLLSYTQTIKDVFAPEITTGFYRFDANSINTPFKGLGYINKISWNANESRIIAYAYNSTRVFTGFKDKNTGDVKYAELMRFGDCGIGANVGEKAANFDQHLASGFYQANTAKFSNLPFSGKTAAASLTVYPTENPDWKVEQLCVADNENPRVFYRTDTKVGKKSWCESVTTLNISNYLPVGVPLPWPTKTPPAGWFECNGAPFDKNKCKKLAIAYPSGRLPDLRGEFIRGWDNGRNADPKRGLLSLQPCDIQRHNHSQNIRPCGEQGQGNPWGSGSNDRVEGDYWFVTGETGGNETRPRNVSFMYIVKAE